ncbi:MAG: hypothetical protein Q4C10_14455 [Clostridia bacterium]|nr:hypothetical protein [Clostridia bacterium]
MVHARGNWHRMAAALLALLALCALFPARIAAPAAAEAAEDASLAIEFTVRPGVLVAPGDVTMTFVIVNQTDLPVQNVYLASADGLLSEPIGQIGPRESQTLVRPHTVTEAELDAGAITYTVSHDARDPQGEKVSYSLSAPITRSDARPSVDFTRQLSSNSVIHGGQVTVTYRLVNTGNVPLSALRLRDSLGDFTGRLEQLEVGETRAFISRVTLNEPAESAPVLEYATPSGQTASIGLDPASIRIADSALDLSFSVGRSVFSQDTADAVLILTNNGDVDYRNITVLDDVYGGVIADAVTLPGGGAPVEISRTYPLRGEGQYRWRITGSSSAGEALDLRTDTLTVSNAPEEQTVDIRLDASARTPRINRPGQVSFDFAITNAGSVVASDALLYEVNQGEIRRLAVLPTGEPTRFAASYRVDGNSQFIFCLNYTDAQGRQRTVSTAPIEVRVAADGVAPERTEAAGMALEGQSVKPGSSSSTFVVLLIIAGAALTVMITILVIASVQARRERRQRIAAEKKRIHEELGKTNPFTPVKASTGKKKKK